jgi:YggT family protein
MLTILTLINLALDFLFYIIIAQAILSWLVAFDVLNTRQPFVYQIWYGLNRITDPIYRPIRRFLPDMGGIDISPMIVLFGIIALQQVLLINFGGMAYGY